MATQRQLIIKADDYGRTLGLEPWRRFFDCALEAGYLPSVGVIAASFGRKASGETHYLRALREEYGLEIWNHSLNHPDFAKLPAEAIRAELAESQRIIEAETGVAPDIFGPPFNSIDGPSARAVLDFGGFAGFYCCDGFVPEALNISRADISALEFGTRAFRPVRPSLFKKEMEARRWPDFLLVQVHPYYWSAACVGHFKDILRQLKAQGYQAVSAAERLAYLRGRRDGTPPQPGRSLADNLLYEERALACVEDDLKAGRMAAGDSAYYVRMLKSGTDELRLFLRGIGFFQLPKVKGEVPILDVGAGIGNWSAAAGLIPGARVTALDREDRHLRYLAAHSAPDGIRIVIDSLEQAELAPAGFAGLICNNTLNYIDLLDALERFAALLCNGGMAYVGLQNRLYPLRDVLNAVRRQDWPGALAYFARLLDNEGAKCGLAAPPFIRYWNCDELAAAALGCGLRLLRRNLSPPGSYGDLFGQPVFSGHLFVKVSGGQALREAIRAGAADDPLFQEIHAASRGVPTVPCPSADAVAALRAGPAATGPAAAAAALVAQGRWGEAQAQAGAFGPLRDSFAFYVGAQAGQAQIPFADPLYGWLLKLRLALAGQDAEAAQAAARGIEQYLAGCEEQALGYWL
jgi:peptidoglycan/xylan/chitin deacetylase (PgdA/CDA1 family)/SAM-dependent methyltransferase